jgi:hypothetical protein
MSLCEPFDPAIIGDHDSRGSQFSVYPRARDQRRSRHAACTCPRSSTRGCHSGCRPTPATDRIGDAGARPSRAEARVRGRSLPPPRPHRPGRSSWRQTACSLMLTCWRPGRSGTPDVPLTSGADEQEPNWAAASWLFGARCGCLVASRSWLSLSELSSPGGDPSLLMCLLLRSSWLTLGGRHVGAAGVLQRRGGRAAVAVSVGVADGVPSRQPRMTDWRPPRLLLLGGCERRAPRPADSAFR